ncbi:MAG: helix-turn-helix transcriptional regulator [Acetobacteraceae bacterium]|nr:helix-turn-helix transcriptional regulator [Acetobacteraceae bacterium]
MTPDEFKTWRKALGLSQKKAADALGLKNRIVQYYEKGERDGERVKIPKHVRLACYALSIGVGDYHGPGPADGAASGKGRKRPRKRKRDAAAATPEAG